MTAPALPPSVAELNHLLAARGAPDHRLRRALGISYGAHVLAGVAALLALRAGAYREYGASAGGGGFTMVNAYGISAPGRTTAPAPRAATRPVPPPAPPPPVAPVAEPPRREPPADDADIAERPQRKPAATPRPTVAKEAWRPGRATPLPSAPPPAPGTGSDTGVEPSTSRDGQALGSISGTGPGGGPGGGGGGGLGRLRFGNQWYIQRVQDLVLSNWGNPFPGQDKPRQALEVVVYFRILRDGTVTDAQLEQPSGNPAWDRAALRAVENTLRLPPLPADYPERDVSVHYKFLSDALQ